MSILVRQIALILLLASLTGCSAMMTSATGRLADSLGDGILNQDDPQIVADGAPAYLLLIDGMIEDNPHSVPLLSSGARLYGAYASVFVKDPKRGLKMSEKALKYSVRAMCEKLETLCENRDKPYEQYSKALATVQRSDIKLVYNFAVNWAGWISARSDDWNAIGDLPKVRASLERIVKLDPDYDNGGAQLYLGVMGTLLPPALGGKPEKAKAYFENAIRISRGRNLMAKVLFAKHYARLVFDQKLHDRLLKEVLAAKTREPGYTLMNTLAKDQARDLLASGKNYF
ncbi:MAG: TRAP transporter TatT component family protein [Acidiferrobacterales bacterium]